MNEEIKQKVRRLVLFGAAKKIIARALGALTETVIVDDLQAAVRDAAAQARPGDVVLLSPACSSFDQFRNYAERGKAFQKARASNYERRFGCRQMDAARGLAALLGDWA